MKWLVSITAAVTVTALCVRAAAGFCAERPEISAKAAAGISADTGETL